MEVVQTATETDELLRQVITELKELRGVVKKDEWGEVTYATLSVIRDERKNWPKSKFRGCFVKFVSGNLTDESKLIKENTEKEITPNANFSAIPELGSIYRIMAYNENWEVAGALPGDSYRRNDTVTTGNSDPATAYASAKEHKVYAYLGRRATQGFILNKDTTATLFVWVSSDGTTFYGSGTGEGVGVEYFPVPPSTQFTITPLIVHTLKVGADSNTINFFIGII